MSCKHSRACGVVRAPANRAPKSVLVFVADRQSRRGELSWSVSSIRVVSRAGLAFVASPGHSAGRLRAWACAHRVGSEAEPALAGAAVPAEACSASALVVAAAVFDRERVGGSLRGKFGVA